MRRIRTRVIVSGRVQGVWFRGSTEQKAVELGLSGWVRNLPDGRVEAEFEGPYDAVDAAIAFVWIGPRHARVEDVEIVESHECEADPTTPLASFRIR